MKQAERRQITENAQLLARARVAEAKQTACSGTMLG
jgi:hypothetical protein